MEVNTNIINNNDILMSIEKKIIDTPIKIKFLLHYKKFDINSNTYRVYELNIRRIYNYFSKKKNIYDELSLIQSITVEDMENYFINLKENTNYKKNTINTIIAVLSEFFSYCCSKRHCIAFSPMDVVEKFKRKEVRSDKKIKEVPTPAQLEKILNATKIRQKGDRNFYFKSTRDRFLISLLASSGLRIEEALGIKLSDIEKIKVNNKYAYMINIDGSRVKNDINKRVPICGKVIDYYKEYLRERMKLKNVVNCELLFVSNNLKKINTTDCNWSIKKIVDKAELDLDLSNHCFRHYCAVELTNVGASKETIYSILGWKSGDIIEEYICHDKHFDLIKIQVCEKILYNK